SAISGGNLPAAPAILHAPLAGLVWFGPGPRDAAGAGRHRLRAGRARRAAQREPTARAAAGRRRGPRAGAGGDPAAASRQPHVDPPAPRYARLETGSISTTRLTDPRESGKSAAPHLWRGA